MCKKVFLPVFLLAGVLMGGCTTAVHLDDKRSELPRFEGGVQPVYVTNSEMAPEYRILKSSQIYQLSNRREGARLLTLSPMHQGGGCGNPMMAAIFTLGIVPAVLRANCVFEYELQTDNTSEVIVHYLPVYDRFSIWEWPMKWNQTRVFAQALALSTSQRRPNRVAGRVAPPSSRTTGNAGPRALSKKLTNHPK
jgi:hypothetical protein